MIINLLIGIISGVISGIFVTIIYRQIDSKRERILILESTKMFISQFLAIDSHDIDQTHKFIQCNCPPQIHKWTPLNREEREFLYNLNNICSDLLSVLSDYYVNKTMNNINDIERQKYTTQISSAHVKMLEISIDLTHLIYFNKNKQNKSTN